MTASPWIGHLVQGWHAAMMGHPAEALEHYTAADEIGRTAVPGQPIECNPALSLLRHMEGEAEGFVRPHPPTEDMVVQLNLRIPTRDEAHDARGMTVPRISGRKLRESLTRFAEVFQPAPHHRANLRGDAPHLQVLSTGRCGTVSLYHLLERSDRHLPYHSFLFGPAYDARYEMAARLLTGELDDLACADFWLTCRAAEWLGAVNAGMAMADLCHLDTVFAPALAALHPQARFIHLRRHPLMVYRSFAGKSQWSDSQVQPIACRFDGGFAWRTLRYDEPVALAWYVRFHEVFASAFADVHLGRCVEIQSEGLFDRDATEIAKLIDAAGLNMSADEVATHFLLPYNTKAHKIDRTEDQLDRGADVFANAYITLGGSL